MHLELLYSHSASTRFTDYTHSSSMSFIYKWAKSEKSLWSVFLHRYYNTKLFRKKLSSTHNYMMLIFTIMTHRSDSAATVNSEVTHSQCAKKQQNAVYVQTHIKSWTVWKKESCAWTVNRHTRHNRRQCAKSLKAFWLSVRKKEWLLQLK